MRKIHIGTCPVLIPRWSVGERVKRRVDVYDQMSLFRHGVVALRYSIIDTGSEYSQDYPEVYAVQWDDGRFEKAFLRHGLEVEEPKPRPCSECGDEWDQCEHGYSEYVQRKMAGELD